jgi:hypothetical protein
MALSVVSNVRMQATKATFGNLPATSFPLGLRLTSSHGSPVGWMSAMLGVPIAAKIRFATGTGFPIFAVQ